MDERAHATAGPVVAAIVAVRRRYPTWGAAKILSVLGEREPSWALPAVSAANDVLRRAGLVESRRRRRPIAHPLRPGRRARTERGVDGRFQRPISFA